MKLIDIVFIAKFDAETEKAFNKFNLARYAPLVPPTMVIGILIVIGLQFWNLRLDPDSLSKTGPIGLVLILFLIICTLLPLYPPTYATQRNWLLYCLFLYIGSAIGLSTTLALLPGGPTVGVGALILGTIAVPAFVRGAIRSIVVLVVYLAVCVTTLSLMGTSRFDLFNVIWWVSVSSSLAVFFAHLFDVVNRRAFLLDRLLETERHRSETLLKNLLPESVSNRLKNGDNLIADRHDSVSVLFADLAGFTDLSLQLSANELVKLLNELFSQFDLIVEEQGAEKIKTIGDAYLVASGLFDRTGNHADQIAETALQMQQVVMDFSKRTGHELSLRIGIHSGPVIAGVIGKRKLAYDLWGNTVNTANRMETEGLPGKVQLTVETRDMLSDRYPTARRGEIKIKGQSPRVTYLLKGRPDV